MSKVDDSEMVAGVAQGVRAGDRATLIPVHGWPLGHPEDQNVETNAEKEGRDGNGVAAH